MQPHLTTPYEHRFFSHFILARRTAAVSIKLSVMPLQGFACHLVNLILAAFAARVWAPNVRGDENRKISFPFGEAVTSVLAQSSEKQDQNLIIN